MMLEEKHLGLCSGFQTRSHVHMVYRGVSFIVESEDGSVGRWIQMPLNLLCSGTTVLRIGHVYNRVDISPPVRLKVSRVFLFFFFNYCFICLFCCCLASVDHTEQTVVLGHIKSRGGQPKAYRL